MTLTEMLAETKLTPERLRRMRDALAETHAFLARETAYMPHLQNTELVTFYRAHAAKLERQLLAEEETL